MANTMDNVILARREIPEEERTFDIEAIFEELHMIHEANTRRKGTTLALIRLYHVFDHMNALTGDEFPEIKTFPCLCHPGPEDMDTPDWVCPDCHDTGWFTIE